MNIKLNIETEESLWKEFKLSWIFNQARCGQYSIQHWLLDYESDMNHPIYPLVDNNSGLSQQYKRIIES